MIRRSQDINEETESWRYFCKIQRAQHKRKEIKKKIEWKMPKKGKKETVCNFVFTFTMMRKCRFVSFASGGSILFFYRFCYLSSINQLFYSMKNKISRSNGTNKWKWWFYSLLPTTNRKENGWSILVHAKLLCFFLFFRFFETHKSHKFKVQFHCFFGIVQFHFHFEIEKVFLWSNGIFSLWKVHKVR